MSVEPPLGTFIILPALRAVFDYVIGGIGEAAFHSFDPESDAWQLFPIVKRSSAGARIETVWQYGPVNNVFILVSGRPGSLRTKAYRFRHRTEFPAMV